MERRLTPEEARTIELPPLWRPIRRLGRLAELGSEFHLQKVGWSPLPQYMTRGDLVRTAENYDASVMAQKIIEAVDARLNGETRGE